jgi:hypothetical protein
MESTGVPGPPALFNAPSFTLFPVMVVRDSTPSSWSTTLNPGHHRNRNNRSPAAVLSYLSGMKPRKAKRKLNLGPEERKRQRRKLVRIAAGASIGALAAGPVGAVTGAVIGATAKRPSATK